MAGLTDCATVMGQNSTRGLAVRHSVSSGLRIALPGLALVAVITLASLGAGCDRPAGSVGTATPGNQAVWFADITEKSGLDFVHDVGPTGNYFMPQSVGSGVALFDYDNDGRLDIYLIQNGGPKGAEHGLDHQERGGPFKEVCGGPGRGVGRHSHGGAVGGFNNDRLPCEFGS